MPVSQSKPRPTGMMQTASMVLVNPQADPLQWLACAFLEAKADLDDPGDSNFQGAAHYGIFWQSRCTSDAFRRTCCPALLLKVVGPYLRVSALYWADKVTVRPLTDFTNLFWIADDPDHMVRLASTLLTTAKVALQELHDFYSQQRQQLQQQQQQQSAAAQPVSRAAFLSAGMPYPMAGYRHVTRLDDGQLVYGAVLSADGKPVVVRLVRRCGEAAHRAWAAVELAPQLRRVVRLPGGWLQVEMEWLKGADGWQELASMREPVAAAAASAAAQAALQRAHGMWGDRGERFAHGDMRVQNIMVRQQSGGSSGEAGAYDVKFIDFEWSGVDGEAVYPPYMSTCISWPAGVAFGEPVRQQHDTVLLAGSVEQLLQCFK